MAGQAYLSERSPPPQPATLVYLGVFVGMILILVGTALTQVNAESDKQQKQAITAIVTGNDQHVGFRAMIMKQAIKYNLAGYAKNETDGTVHFTLQGESDRLETALAVIRAGTKKSSDIQISASQAAVDRDLSTFTIIDWTSTSRNITTPYTLVYTLRADDKMISKSDAREVWHQILRTTLRGEDSQKLGDDY